MPVLTGRTSAQVDEALEGELVKAAALNASDEFFAQHGAQHPLGVGFTGAQDILPQDWDEQTALSYIKGIPPSLLRNMALVGSIMQRSLRNGLAAMGPFLKIVRGLRRL